ncbi:hypothetical protein Tco_1384093 [Tanacetum coccineum]
MYQPLTIQILVYQAPSPAPQMQGVSKTDFENYVKANDAVLRNMQNQGQGLQNQMTNLREMLSKLINSNTPSSSSSGTLPSQIVTNHREHINAIITRSGKTCEGPSTPHISTPVVSTPLKEPEQNPETSMDKVQKPDEPFSGSTTIHSDALPPSSSLGKTMIILRSFADELTFLIHFHQMVEDVENENSNVSNSDEPVLLNTPLSDKEGYYDSEGDVIFLESLFSDDTTHNLSPEVIFDHEPKQNESIHNTSITFSPRSDPLHHEFTGEIITLPSRIAREHEDT